MSRVPFMVEAGSKKKGSSALLQSPDFLIVAAGLLATVLLLPPLRGILAGVPLAAFLSVMVLFLVPGCLGARWLLGEHVRGLAILPAGFALSTGIFAFLGVPMMMLGLGMTVYLFACVLVVGVSMGAGLAAASRGDGAAEIRYGESAGVLWVPFGILAAGLVLVGRLKTPNVYDDMWVYLSYVREFIGSEHLARFEPYFGGPTGLSRLKINGWLLEHAALSQVSGLDPVEMVIWYLNPALVVVCLVAIYALTRVLFESETAGVLAGCLCAVYFSTHLGASVMQPGSEFAARLAEDKYAARFLFLPVALMAAALFARHRKKAYLLFFGCVCWAVVGVHPIGYAILGLALAGFGVVYLVMHLRERAAWFSIAGLGAVGASVVALPLLLVPATGTPLADLLRASDISSGDPRVIANMVFVRPEREKLWEFADGSYVMHPALIFEDQVVMAAFVIGVPFLLWRVRRSLAAQFLLGMLLLSTVVVYVPQIATFVGDNLVLPWQIHRLAWVLHLSALLTICFLIWEIVRFVTNRLQSFRGARRVAPFLPTLIVVSLMALAVPPAVAGAFESSQSNRMPPENLGVGFDPIYPWLRDNVDEPSVLMAPDVTNTIIPAWSANANVISLRGGLLFPVLEKLQARTNNAIQPPEGSLAVFAFYHITPDPRDKLELLRRHNADYVMVIEGSRVEERLQDIPGVTPIKTPPSSRYNLYDVDQKRIGG